MNYTFNLSLSESVGDLTSGRIDLEEYLNQVCDRIDAVEPAIHALLPESNRRERLIREAGALKTRFPDPAGRPLLFGIPVGVKDIFNVDGFPTRCGSLLPEELFIGKESSVVTRLKEAGAIILGKTVTTEFAYFEPGPTSNPHNPSHTPGGSSSGSAAAVACGYTPLALGTQTIGSITRPASFCGVFGCKPSLGRIATDGVIPFSGSADHVGFFTQDMAGMEIAASILCSDWKRGLRTPKGKPVIGVVTGDYLDQADDEVLQFFEKKIHEFERRGFILIRADVFGDIEPVNIAHRNIAAYEFAQTHNKWFERYSELYRSKTKELIIEGALIDSEVYLNARSGMRILREKVEKIREEQKIDVWLSPSSVTAAPPGLSSTGSPLMNLPWTYTGLPTVSIPYGTNSDGLPFGLQVAGSFFQDELLFDWLKQLL